MGTKRDPLDGDDYDYVIRQGLAEARSAANSGQHAVATAWARIAHVAVLAKEAAERTR